MAKKVADAVLDAALDYIISNADKMVACSAEPGTYAEATSTYDLADVSMAGGDYTKAAGDTSGRKVTMAQKTGVTINHSGTATHIALVKTTTTAALLYVTTCNNLALNSGQTMTFGSWAIELRAPT
jgi:hypothetical protein